MKGDMELISRDGQVVGHGRVGEWLHLERSDHAATLCIDQGNELLLVEIPGGGTRELTVNAQCLSDLLR